MLTTTALAEDVKRAMELGANDYIMKPVSFEDFVCKMRQLEHYWGSVSDARIGLFTDQSGLIELFPFLRYNLCLKYQEFSHQ